MSVSVSTRVGIRVCYCPYRHRCVWVPVSGCVSTCVGALLFRTASRYLASSCRKCPGPVKHDLLTVETQQTEPLCVCVCAHGCLCSACVFVRARARMCVHVFKLVHTRLCTHTHTQTHTAQGVQRHSVFTKTNSRNKASGRPLNKKAGSCRQPFPAHKRAQKENQKDFGSREKSTFNIYI